MKVLDAIKTASIITLKNTAIFLILTIILITLLFLLSTAASLYSNKLLFVVYSLLALFLCLALQSGWLNVIKRAISIEISNDTTKEEKEIEHIKSLKAFFPGVGEYFFPLTILQILFFIIMMVIDIISSPIQMMLFKAIGIDLEKLQALSANSEALMQQVKTLEPLQIGAIVLYALGIIAIMLILFFWGLPALFYNSKNPLEVLKLNFKFLSKHFFQTIAIAIFLGIIYSSTNLVILLLNANSLLSLVGLFIQYYVISFSFVLLFLYYGQNGEHSAKDYINSGDDCDGEKLAGSDSGENA